MKRLLIIIWIISLISGSCRKLVETDPPSNQITGTSVFAFDGSAIAIFNRFYDQMNGAPFQGVSHPGSINLLAGLSADELVTISTSGNLFFSYNNQLISQPSLSLGGEAWIPLFQFIYRCNDAIEGLNKSGTLTPAVKQQLLGEAKFLRAFCYFYLVNLFGDTPLALTTDADVNTMLSRSPKDQVYEQIITDLKEAETLLSTNFLDGKLTAVTTERVRPTKWAATALLARVYLYLGSMGKTENWAKAEEAANAVIANTALFGPLPSLNNAFLKNSREAIWQIQPTSANLNTVEGSVLNVPTTGPGANNPVFLSQHLRSSFESNDVRAILGNWVNKVVYNVASGGKDSVYFAFKYKKDAIASNGVVTSLATLSEYFMVLRLGEQYLIRAEARAKQGNLSGAIADLDSIRKRANLPLLGTTNSGISQSALLDKILDERRHELFCEWGHRWFDLKRTGKIDEVMTIITPIKSAGTTVWQPYQALYPIPYSELLKGPNLVQTPGY